MTYTLYIKTSDKTNSFYNDHKEAYEGDSGIDLFFPEDVICEPFKTKIIDLDICCEMYKGNDLTSYYVYPRSSISKTPLMMHNNVGIIDAGYRHSIKIAIRNMSHDNYKISSGDRLFQICSPTLEGIKVSLRTTLSKTSRGEGFGSSGK